MSAIGSRCSPSSEPLTAGPAALEAGVYAMIFDARKLEDYDLGHLPTAMSLPATDFPAQFANFMAFLQPADRILVYCSGKECDESLAVARQLRDQGFAGVEVYVGGFADWQAAGREVE